MERLDETLDTGELVLDGVPIADKEPFAPKAKFRIERYETSASAATPKTFDNPSADNLAQEIDRVQSADLRRGIGGTYNASGGEIEMTAAVELNVRNESQKTLLMAEGERSEQYGVSLVQISAHPSSCPLCAPWQGRVLINDTFGNGTDDGKHELLSTAIAEGLFHYNCRHEYITYIPGYSRDDIYKFDKASKQETAMRYVIEQEQRLNERMIRQWKREADGSLSPERQAVAKRHVADWQGRQRATQKYAEQQGIPFYRQYSREQIGGETTPTIKPEVLEFIKRKNFRPNGAN